MKIVLKQLNIDTLLLFPCLFCISWLNRGLAGQLKIINFKIFILAFFAWFILALYIHNWKMKISNIWFWVYALLLCIYSFTHTSIFNFMSYAAVYMIILSVFYDYYSAARFRRERKLILAFYLLENLIIAVRTAYVCFMDPLFSRNITASKNILSDYQDILIARFDNIYTYAMLAVLLIAIAPRTKHKMMCYVSALIFMICVYYANYSTALFVMCVFVIFALTMKRPKWILVTVLASLIGCFVLTPYISELLLSLSKLEVISSFIRGKLVDIYDFLNGLGQNNKYNTLYDRMRLSLDAIHIFQDHFLIGIYGRPNYAASLSKIHNHNVWIDMLAYFGIIRSIPFIMIIYTWYQKSKKYFYQWKSSPLSLMLLLWVIFGFLNPVSRTANHEFLFFILPLFGQYYSEEYSDSIQKIQ